MTWKELPPDFSVEPLSELFRSLSFTDAFAICQYSGNHDFLLLLDRNADRSAQAYVASRSVESGGLLLGRTFINSGEIESSLKYVVTVSDCVCADDAHGTATALRMEPQLWTKAGAVKGPDQFVVGWFHSHPNLGAFFSGTDKGTQASFFRDIHKVGWVIDPVRNEEAWFVGPQSNEVLDQMVVRGDYSSLT